MAVKFDQDTVWCPDEEDLLPGKVKATLRVGKWKRNFLKR